MPPESFLEDVKAAWEIYRTRTERPRRFDSPQTKLEDQVVLQGMKVTFIGHATVLLQVDGLNILTDPVFSDYIGATRVFSQKRVTNAGTKLEHLPPYRCHPYCHNHYDHLDLPSLERIAAQQGDAPPRILTGLGNNALLQKHGVRNVSELDWGDTVELSGMGFHFLEAVHTSGRGLFDTNKSLWGAFLVNTPEGNIYFAGDTAYGKHFRHVYDQFGPVKLALLPTQEGKLAVVTGANGGIGWHTALELARAGSEVILTARTEVKGRDAEKRIRQQVPDAKVRFEVLDLASLRSIRAFAARVGSEAKLDLLVNNAGVMSVPTRQVTEDGFELQFGTNFLGPFALTALLMPVLQRAASPRVTTV
jgi:L-ascorbate metabolism protein UlaG (beta-lactamase superfamily)